MELQLKTKLICDRRKYLWLVTENGEDLCIETSCKTWKCKVCRPNLLKKVKSRMIYGCLTLDSTWFITLTYKATSQRLRGVSFAREDWAQLLRLWRQWSPEIAWFRVMELTQQRIIHFHLLVGNLPASHPTSCKGKAHEWGKEWREELGKCECLEHVVGAQWLETTGDSYIVAVRKVDTAGGVARYLAKYMQKSFDQRDELEAMGFSRRYSKSRNWPVAQRSVNGKDKWKHTELITGKTGRAWRDELEKYTEGHPALQTPLDPIDDKVEVMFTQIQTTTKAAELERMLRNAGIPKGS